MLNNKGKMTQNLEVDNFEDRAPEASWQGCCQRSPFEKGKLGSANMF